MMQIDTKFKDFKFVSEIKSCHLIATGLSEIETITKVKKELERFYDTLKEDFLKGDNVAGKKLMVLDKYWKNDPYFIYYLDL